KVELIVRRSHLPQRRRHQNEAASDHRTFRLCHCACVNCVGIGYARSDTLCAGRRRRGDYPRQRRTWAWAWAWTWTWVGPSRRSRPSLRLVPWPPPWLAASSPWVVTFTSGPNRGLHWLAAFLRLCLALTARRTGMVATFHPTDVAGAPPAGSRKRPGIEAGA